MTGVGTQRLSGPPTSSRRALIRPRLVTLTQGRFGRRVTAVVAGAGFGKSTLLAQSLEENRLTRLGRDVWLSCTTEHRAVSYLVSDLLAALGDLPGGDLPGADREPDTSLSPDPGTGARLVADALWGLAPTQVCLVLDDLHLITPGSTGHTFLHHLVQRLPGNAHLLFASRPPGLGLSRFIVAGEAIEIGEADLAFEEAELQAFARDRGVPPGLLETVSGWPALAELVATTGHSHLTSYLWEEVLDGLDPSVLTVLTVVAELGAADDDLVSDLLGRRIDLARHLHGLPLVSVDSEGWWSLHRLMIEALRRRSPSPEAAQALRGAGEALRRRGRVREAMRLLIDTRRLDAGLTDVIIDLCAGITPAAPPEVLLNWYEQLPPETRESAAAQLLIGTATKEADPVTARAQLSEAARGFRTLGRRDGELACLLALFHVSFWLNDLPEIRAVLRRWAALAAEGEPEASLCNRLGRALLARTPTEAQAELAALPTRVSGSTAPLVAWVRANLLVLTLGEPDRAQAWAEEALASAPATLRGSIRCDLIEAHRVGGRLDEARRQARQLLAEPSSTLITARHLCSVVILHCVGAESEDARRLLKQLRTSAETSALPWSGLSVALAGAMVHASHGADDVAATELTELDEHPMALPIVLLRITLAALPLQYVLRPASRPGWDDFDLLGVLAGHRRLARAVVELRDGDPGEALDCLTEEDVAATASVLPAPWATLVATGLAASGRPAATVLQALGPTARGALRQLDAAGGPLAKTARRLLASVPSSPRNSLQINVLGPLEVCRDGVGVDDPVIRRERVRQLIALLVLSRSVARHRAAAALWPDLLEADAARNLRVTLNYVQRVLEPDRDERDAPYFVQAHGTMLEVADDAALDVDVWAFERELSEAEEAERRGTASLALPCYLRAVARYRGELLADLPPSTWSAVERDRLRSRFVNACVRAGNLLAANGDRTRAEELAHRALTVEPWSEPAYQLLIGCLLGRGDRAAARHALDRCFEMLAELGVAGSAETFELEAALRRTPPGS